MFRNSVLVLRNLEKINHGCLLFTFVTELVQAGRRRGPQTKRKHHTVNSLYYLNSLFHDLAGLHKIARM